MVIKQCYMKVNSNSEKEIMPLGNYVFVKGINDNPYLVKETESGLILPNGLAHTEADGSGALKTMEQVVKYGEIVEVGPDVKSVAVGDGVYFDIRTIRPIPFGKLGVLQINEQNLLAYVR